MIVAIASLITALFLGGPSEIFYVDNLEKGIKKKVLEKDRKKEILAEIKDTKALNKAFEKERKRDYKSFLDLYSDKNTEVVELISFFDELKETRTAYQNKLIDQRLIIFEKIEAEEWEEILKSSVTVADKNISKAEKKASKGKEAYSKTKSSIENSLSKEEQKQQLLKGLESVISSEKVLEQKIFSINASQNEILANKQSGKEELQAILVKDNELRKELLESLISFHDLARTVCSEAEWTQVMKSFTKEMQMSSR